MIMAPPPPPTAAPPTFNHFSILRTSSISPPPASAAFPPSFYLSTADIFFKDIHYNRRLLFYPSPRLPIDALLHILKHSLSQVLVPFYPWAGRLTPDHHGRLSLHFPNSSRGDGDGFGVPFIEASVDVDMHHIQLLGFPMMPLFDKLAPHIDHTGDSLYTSPLLAVQVTVFSDGGVALGVTQSHVVADGQSLWHFLLSWGECARGVGITTPPLHDRHRVALQEDAPSEEIGNRFPKILECTMEDEDDEEFEEELDDAGAAEIAAAVSTSKEEAGEMEEGAADKADDEASSSSSTVAAAAAGRVQCVFELSGEAIKKLKEEAGGNYTSFEVVCAHFWRRVDAARGSKKKETTTFWVLVNLRSRLQPPLPPSYFGNAIELAMVKTRVGLLRQDEFSRTAERIRRASRSCNQESLRAMIHWLELHDNSFLALGVSGLFSARDVMNVASSPRFPAYEVDFGWGVPAAVRSALVPGDGEMVLFGGRPGSGAGDMEICLSLQPTAMKRLLADPFFLPVPVSDPFLHYSSTAATISRKERKMDPE